VLDTTDLQKRLIGAYLNTPDFVATSPFVGRMADTFTGKLSMIGKHIDSLIAINQQPSMESVYQLVCMDPGSLLPEEVMDLPGSKSEPTVKGYEKQMLDWVSQRHIMEALRNAGKAIDPDKRITDPSPIVSSLIEALRGVQTQVGADINLGEGLREAITKSDEARNNASLSPASWGLHILDTLCPLEPGRMYILAAAPKCGKTSLAMQAAMATAKSGLKVAFASLEMRADELAQVMASRELGFDTRAFRRGQLDQAVMEDIKSLANEWDELDNIIVRDTRGDSHRCADIAAWVKVRHRMAGKLGLVIIDYLQLMESSDSRKSEYEVVTNNTRKLKLLASSLSVPVIVLSQMNREGRKQHMDGGREAGQIEPTLNALRSSGSIEQDADAVMFLWSEKSPNQGEAHRPVQAKLACSRFCDTGRADLMFYGPQQLFSSAATHTDKTDSERGRKLRQAPCASEDLFDTP